jgi:transposase
MKQPDEVKLNREEGEALIERLERDALTSEDRRVLVQLIRLYFWLLFALQEARFSLKRLRRLLFGDKRKKRKGGSSGGSSEPGEGDGPSAAGGATPLGASAGRQGPSGGRRPGRGRQGAEAYVGAARVTCRHEELAVGERCPVCGRGRLYRLPSGVEMRLDGNALVTAIRYELEKLRCSACGEVFTAELPREASAEKYSARARAVLAVGRYYLGLPFYRLEGYQAMLGVPVSDATQWEQIERVGDCGYRVFAPLEHLAAQGDLIHQDDTPVRILSLLKENQALEAYAESAGVRRAQERTGMSTTALVVRVGERTICLYYSGRSHAGENLASLLHKRQAGRDKPLVMSDALSHNEADEAAVIRCHCLAHGRRKFSDLEDVFPGECQVVLEALKQVFEHDEEARQAQMGPRARLAYHQRYSGPIMEALGRWLEAQFADRLVEPNSSLGKAMAYLQRHWETLTRFLHIAGAPLDNNLCERALKLFIRQRQNSLFYKTEHGAYVASVLTSLIATCVHAGVNAVEYLVALQEHRREVFTTPAAWLPWTYQATLAPP